MKQTKLHKPNWYTSWVTPKDMFSVKGFGIMLQSDLFKIYNYSYTCASELHTLHCLVFIYESLVLARCAWCENILIHVLVCNAMTFHMNINSTIPDNIGPKQFSLFNIISTKLIEQEINNNRATESLIISKNWQRFKVRYELRLTLFLMNLRARLSLDTFSNSIARLS